MSDKTRLLRLGKTKLKAREPSSVVYTFYSVKSSQVELWCSSTRKSIDNHSENHVSPW